MRPASPLLGPQTRFARTVRASVGGKPATPVALLVVAVAVSVIYFFDPATAGFYPSCLFKSVLGMGCPGCGSLRAVHQLLHGNFDAAWGLNRLVVVALPLAGLAGVIGLISRRTRTSNG